MSALSAGTSAPARRLALLFDLDGTLIDSIELLLQSMEHSFHGRTHRPSRAHWTSGIGTPLRSQLAEWASDVADGEVLLNRYREYQSERLESLTTLYPGIGELLAWARARGHVLAIVTSKGRGMTDRSLAHLGLLDAFDAIVTAEATDKHKPLPDPVWHALSLLGMTTSDALFVGDSTHDMNAGRSAQVATAAALWGPFTRAELEPTEPTFWLESVADLQNAIVAMENR